MFQYTHGDFLGAWLKGTYVSQAQQIADNSITLPKLEAGTQGDILYANSSGTWTKLNAGTAGQKLQTNGAGANPSWTSVGAGISKVADYTVSGSPTTTISFTGLDINTDKCYIAFLNIKNALAQGIAVGCWINGDTLYSNYTTQSLTANGATLTGERSSDNYIFRIDSQSSGSGTAKIFKNVTNYPQLFGEEIKGVTSGTQVVLHTICKNATVTNITQIDFGSNVANGIDVGSYVGLFKTG